VVRKMSGPVVFPKPADILRRQPGDKPRLVIELAVLQGGHCADRLAGPAGAGSIVPD
jgi:hypothetical protein